MFMIIASAIWLAIATCCRAAALDVNDTGEARVCELCCIIGVIFLVGSIMKVAS